jgi:hypothetical protein
MINKVMILYNIHIPIMSISEVMITFIILMVDSNIVLIFLLQCKDK